MLMSKNAVRTVSQRKCWYKCGYSYQGTLHVEGNYIKHTAKSTVKDINSDD
jgi:hypothetical protein